MSQKFMLKIIARSALLLLAGFAGVSAAQAQAIEQKVAVCKACHLTGTLQSTSVIPNIWGQSEGYIYIQLRDFKSGARNANAGKKAAPRFSGDRILQARRAVVRSRRVLDR